MAKVNGQEFKIVLPMDGHYLIRSEANPTTGADEDWLYIEGIASDTTWDRKNGKVYPEAIRAMVDTVNGPKATPIFENDRKAAVGVDVDHSNVWKDQIGELVERRVIEKSDGLAMWVKRRVDLGMSAGHDLKRALDRGKKLGWSIYGIITDGFREVVKSTGQAREHFQGIDLRKVAVTSAPVNANTWLGVVARSMNGVEMETEEMECPAEETTETPAQEAAEEATETKEEVQPDLADIVSKYREQLLALMGLGGQIATLSETKTEEAPATEEVNRSEKETDEEKPAEITRLDPTRYILRAEVATQLGEVHEILRGLPAELTARDEEITKLRDERAELRRSHDELVLAANDLTEAMNFFLAQPAGRPGIVLGRSFKEEMRDEQSASDPLTVLRSMTAPQRARHFAQMTADGKKDERTLLMLQLGRSSAPVNPSRQLSPAARKQIGR